MWENGETLTKKNRERSHDVEILNSISDKEVEQYTLRIYGLKVTREAIAVKVVWDFQFTLRAFEEAKRVLEVKDQLINLNEKSHLAKLLRVERDGGNDEKEKAA